MRPKKWRLLTVEGERWRLILTICFSLLTAGCACALIFTSGYLISKSALRPENVLMVYIPIVLVRAFGIGKAVSRYMERLIGHHMVLKVLANMRVRLYRILEPQALFVRSRYRTGDLLSTLADDIEHLQDYYIRTLFPTLVAFVAFVGWLIGVGWFDLSFAMMTGFMIWLMIFVFPMISLWITHRKQRRIKQWKQAWYQKLTDAVMGVQDWMISGLSSTFIRDYVTDEKKVMAVQRRLHRFQQGRLFLLQGLVGMMLLLMAIWMGEQIAEGKMAAPFIAAGVLVILPLMELFLPVSEAVEKIPQYQDSIHRLNQMNQPPAIILVNRSQVSKEEITLAKQCADLQLENLFFRYESSDQGIKNVSLTIPAGKKVAILGRSGAGKSTLIKLIRGDLIPERGRVTINGIEADRFGDQIAEIISVCDQRPHLFDTTVANNIRLGNPNASDKSIREVAKQVKLDRLLASLPLGFDTPMYEMGSRFSGGERQRIALARVLLQDTPIVILDEPTVGLDPQTEHDLLQTIFQVFQNKTLIWITHHLMGVEQMDEVIFMDHGRITMRGSHEQLLDHNPRYRRLYQLDRPDWLGGRADETCYSA